MIKILYANPSATILTGQINSQSFPIGRGSRQSCPLSLLLFALSLEPLAQAVRQSELILPISVKNTSDHISLFADDILLFLDNPVLSVRHVLNLFNQFSNLSRYKINWTKSYLLPLNFCVGSATFSGFIPVVHSFTYLSVDIYLSLQDIVSKDLNKNLANVTSDLANWTHLPTSFLARISVVKMNILPRVNLCQCKMCQPHGGLLKNLLFLHTI